MGTLKNIKKVEENVKLLNALEINFQKTFFVLKVTPCPIEF